MRRFRHCPACGAELEWHAVEVDAGADGPVPDEDWSYAACACGIYVEAAPWAEDEALRTVTGAVPIELELELDL